MRVTSLIVTLALLVGSATSAAGCPVAQEAPSCCCDDRHTTVAPPTLVRLHALLLC